MDSRQFYVVLCVVTLLTISSGIAAAILAFLADPSGEEQKKVVLMFEHIFTFGAGAIVALLSTNRTDPQ